MLHAVAARCRLEALSPKAPRYSNTSAAAALQKKTASMTFLDLSPALLIPLMIFGSAAVLLLALYLAKPKPFLDGTRQSLKLQEIKVLSPDTKLFRFALPSDKHCFGLP